MKDYSVSVFFSEIGFKPPENMVETHQNTDAMHARIDKLATDVARLAGVRESENPAKTILGAIEHSGLIAEILDLVADAALDCEDLST
jgi:hypothetical protein